MNNEFIEPEEEVKRVAEEICLLRKDIQTAASVLSRIERRLKAAFPNYPTKNKQSHENYNRTKVSSLKTAEELQLIFNDLVWHTQNGGDGAFASQMGKLNDEDVVALAFEVGISSRSRLSRNKAIEAIRKRVQEAMQLQFENKKLPTNQ